MLLGILLSTIASCLSPPDVPMCVETEYDKEGWCTYTIKEEEFFVDNENNLYPIPDESGKKRTWKELKVGSLIMPAHSAAQYKEFVMKVCKKSKKCEKQIASWDRNKKKLEDKKKR